MSPILNLSFGRGVLCGVLAIVAANGLHWLNTPSIFEASGLRIAGVAAQVVVCAVGAVWVYAREKRSMRATLPTPAEAR